MHPRIKLQSAPKNPINVGRALTIKTRSGDNLMLHKALNMAKPGDVSSFPMTAAKATGP